MFHSMDILMSMWIFIFSPFLYPLIPPLDYMQQNQDTTHIYVKYATLSEYFAAVMATPNISYPTNTGGDFFPLDEQLYWTVCTERNRKSRETI